MKVSDSIDAVQKYIKWLSRNSAPNSNNDKLITLASKNLGISASWISDNIQIEQKAPAILRGKKPELEYFEK